MKKRTLLTLASVYIACSGYAQQPTESLKIDMIKKDPVSYQNSGGTLDSDLMFKQPEKTEKVIDPNGQFVIYKNSENQVLEGSMNYMLIKDQSSEEYRMMKDKHLKSNPVQESAEEVFPKSAQERNKLYHKK